ncbi:MAG: thymidylate synthase [Bacillota bacterium]
MIFQHNYIEGRTIEDVWRDAMWCCIRSGYAYRVEVGSYAGQIRKQLDYVVIRVLEPNIRPLSVRTPEACGFAAPTSEDKIWKYFSEYIIGTEKSPNEDYTYGQFIAPQIPRAVALLNDSSGNTNQACIQIGDAHSIYLNDPPCLRVITFKVVNGMLQLSVFFRSWDLFAGLPENLGGLQLLKEYILAQLSFEVQDGPIVAYSDGLHIYEQYFPLVNVLNIDKIEQPKKTDQG